jgi:hypothetical protein
MNNILHAMKSPGRLGWSAIRLEAWREEFRTAAISLALGVRLRNLFGGYRFTTICRYSDACFLWAFRKATSRGIKADRNEVARDLVRTFWAKNDSAPH